ncbi:hypothetical protein Barb6_00992 [Bacteroidales bacterium Barb6]|nr:hypothetical protein Barb6_00992 [Bacteroidales bacterium Barb6]
MATTVLKFVENIEQIEFVPQEDCFFIRVSSDINNNDDGNELQIGIRLNKKQVQELIDFLSNAIG